MLLIYIEQKKLLTKLLSYIDETDLIYTTNLNDECDTVLIAELSNRMIEFVKEKLKQGKKIIFLTDFEEQKILDFNDEKSKSARSYYSRLLRVLNETTRVITHMPSIASILEKKTKKEVVIIPYELPIINISRSNKDIFDKYHIPKRKKRIIVMDTNYKYIPFIYELSNSYPKYQFLYIGYESDYLLSQKNRDLIHNLPKNVIKIKYIDLNRYSDLSKICHMVIFFDHEAGSQRYLNITLLFKKQLLVHESRYYENYLNPNKNVYLFQKKEELKHQFKKIIEEKVPNVTDLGYKLVIQHTREEIVKKYSMFLR